jgi:hypothetical protein
MRRKRSIPKRRRRVRDFLLYIVIGVTVVITDLLYAEYGWPENAENTFKWIAFVGNTLVLFGYALQRNQLLHQKLRQSYLLWAVLVVIHSVAWTMIMRRGHHFPLSWFLIMYPLEEPLLDKVLDWNETLRASTDTRE